MTNTRTKREHRSLQTQPTAIEQAWELCCDLYCEAVHPPRVDNPSLENELLFCLLSGFGIQFELARAATEKLVHLEPFADFWRADDLREAIESILGSSLFSVYPGSKSRRFRFPRRKAAQIVAARAWLRSQANLLERLKNRQAAQRRELLCECPGIGPKTSSWILRNLGLCNDLAILDVHIMRALAGAGRIPVGTRLPKDYLTAEKAFLEWCHDLQAPPPAFDLFLWHWQRGDLSVN